MKQRDAFRLCCYPVEESRTIVHAFLFSLKSVFAVFERRPEEDSEVRSGHPPVEVFNMHECVMFID